MIQNQHYKKGKIEPFDVIDDWKLDFYLGNVIKYIARHKHKGTPIADIDKAIDYLQRYRAKVVKELK